MKLQMGCTVSISRKFSALENGWSWERGMAGVATASASAMPSLHAAKRLEKAKKY
jgi:hypothetical protein